MSLRTPAGLEGQYSQHTRLKQVGFHLVAYDKDGNIFQQHRDGKTFAKPYKVANFAGRAELDYMPAAPPTFQRRFMRFKSKNGHAELPVRAGIGIELARAYVANEDVDNLRDWGHLAMLQELGEELPGLLELFSPEKFVALNGGMPILTTRPDGKEEHLVLFLLTEPIPVEEIKTPSGMIRRKLPFDVKEGTGGWFFHPAELKQLLDADAAARVSFWTHTWVRNWLKQEKLFEELDRREDPNSPSPPAWMDWILSFEGRPPPARQRVHTFARTLANLPTPLGIRQARNRGRAEAHKREEDALKAAAQKLLAIR